MAYSTNFSIEELRFDNYGLIPAIAQDWLDGTIPVSYTHLTLPTSDLV